MVEGNKCDISVNNTHLTLYITTVTIFGRLSCQTKNYRQVIRLNDNNG